MKKIIIERIKCSNGDIVLRNRKAKLMMVLTSEYQMLGIDGVERPRKFIHNGKLTDKAKEYIDNKPREFDLIKRLLQ